jgi:phosphoglycolate phosphatase-like HAD superfamily hydrolase
MMTAKSANLYAIGVSWGFRDVEEIRQAGAEWICQSAWELQQQLTA